MISDANKGISNITYNHLNLPVQITFPNGIIKYLYNAAGQKLSKTVTEGTAITATDYLSGFQYKNTKLQFFPHGGRLCKCNRNDGVWWRFELFF